MNPAADIQDQPEDRAPEAAAATGPGPTVTHKYSVNVNSALLRKLESMFSKNSIKLVSAAFSLSTWRSYEAAWNSFAAFEIFVRTSYTWPLSQHAVNEYISWAANTRKLRSASIQSYLASLASIHQLFNHSALSFSSLTTKALLRGCSNLESMVSNPKPSRKVFSLPLLKILGHEIAQMDWLENSKRVFWTCACTAFFGSFRIGELLASKKSSFDPTSTLLWGDIVFGEKSCIVHLRSPKCNSKEGDFVDLFEFKDQSVCPVSCLKNLSCYSGGNKNSPVFQFSSGNLLTPESFNKSLRLLLTPHLGNDAQHFSSHSMRAAIPSALAKFPRLANSEDIKGWGRWDSACYMRYTRLKLDRKRAIFSKISSALLPQAFL